MGTRVGIPVGYQGGYTGYYPATAREEVPIPSEAGPGSPAGAGVVGYGDWTRVLGGTVGGTVIPTLRARSVHLRWPSLV